MAYQVRQRDPLFDSNTQAVIERRGKELLGLALIGLAIAAAMVLGSYAQDDPSWLSATDDPAQNLLGRFGASIASPLFIIVGRGAWAIAAVFAVWGLRFVLHQGETRAMQRALFAPIAVALAAVYAAAHVPGAEWTHSFGLGGLFGDTVLAALLNLSPFPASFGLKLVTVLLAMATLAMGLFVLGVDREELKTFGRFLYVGVVLSYVWALRLIGKSARGAVWAGASVKQKAAERIERRRAEAEEAQAYAEAEEARQATLADQVAPQPARSAVAARVLRAERSWAPPAQPEAQDWQPEPEIYDDQEWQDELPEPELVTQPTPRSGLLGLLKRQHDPSRHAEPRVNAPEPTEDDRIRARIADAIKARVRAPITTQTRAEPPVARPRGPKPMILSKSAPPPVAPLRAALAAAAASPAMPAASGEPPVTMRAPIADAAPGPQAADDGHWSDDAAMDGAYVDEFDADQGDDGTDNAALTAEPLIETQDPYRPAYPPLPDPKKVVQHAPRKPVQPSRQAKAEAQPRLRFEDQHTEYEVPPLSLLSSPTEIKRHHLSDEALEENARMLESVLDDYGVKGEIVSVRPGPVVTMYELEPAPGLKASRVIGLADDIARSMSALSARVSTVPGRSVIGIELPNANREKVVLREILSARDFGDSNMRLPLALGKDIGGDAVVANLAKMPHLLIAGTTGSGKSVAINTMILSLLYKLTPDECRLIMIDPKMLELSVYDGIPHLLSPVVTDPKKAVVALKWVVGEMEERYRKMSKMGVRNIEGFNGRVRDALSKGETFKRTVQTGFDDETGDPVFETEETIPETIPYIVVIVDEMADLMMVAGKEIEACIQRLAQMARASGIHLIMATQRPSVDVITGTIKANFPTRISFQVTSKIDSRTILGEQGAEQLLGMGDMLYMAGGAKITRVHGPFVSDEEVEEIVNHLKSFGPPEYIGGVVEGPDEDRESDIDAVLGLGSGEGDDALYDQAVAVVARDRKCSTSYIQRKLAIGYNKAARLVEQMEDNGVVTPANHVGKRDILLPEH